MKLITETYMDGIESLIENTSTGKKFMIEGRFIAGDVKNANNRIYESKVLKPAVEKYINEYVSRGQGFGEMNHPPRHNVDPERVVMVINSLKKDGSHYNGKATIVNEGLGKIVIGIMEAGGRLGVSTRALGTLTMRDGINYVNPDLVFTAIDVVSNPSGPGCFVNGIMESVDFNMLEDGTIIQLAVDVTKKRITEEKAIKAFADLMIKFSTKK